MSPACSPVFLSFSQLSLALSITPQLSLQSGWNRNLSIQRLTARCQLLLSALSVSPARSGLRADGRSSCGLFCSFSLLYSHLVVVSFFMLFLLIFGSILGVKIDDFSTHNDVIFLIGFLEVLFMVFFPIFGVMWWTRFNKNHWFYMRFTVFFWCCAFSA